MEAEAEAEAVEAALKSTASTSLVMTFITNLYLWTECLWLITISKRIDLKRSAWRHFVDNKLYFHFLLNFS